jgi:polysaccharide biosynthesis/export protein
MKPVPRLHHPALHLRLFTRCLALTCLAGTTACVAPHVADPQREAAPAAVASSLRFQKEYLLAVGDQLDVVVWRTPEASRSVVIRADGHISLPLLQDVPAAGLTPRQLADKLTEGFAQRLVNPQVNVVPTVVRQPTVYVMGDVGQPQAIPLRNASTASQALAVAGGVRRSGAEADASIIRLMPDGQLLAIAVTGSAEGQPAATLTLASLPLQADDILFVPESRRSEASRFIDDFVLKPLSMVLTFRLIQLYY